MRMLEPPAIAQRQGRAGLCGAGPARGALWERSQPHPQGCSEPGVGAGMGRAQGGWGARGRAPSPPRLNPPMEPAPCPPQRYPGTCALPLPDSPPLPAAAATSGGAGGSGGGGGGGGPTSGPAILSRRGPEPPAAAAVAVAAVAALFRRRVMASPPQPGQQPIWRRGPSGPCPREGGREGGGKRSGT